MKESRSALIVGIFAALIHLVWSVLVMVGLAKPYLDFILGLHFLNNPYTVSAFNITKAAMLVAITFVLGYLMGWVFAIIWNRLHKR